ncbi:MAG: glycosyl hydrolase, partial [Candidatus Sumerlaeota bacterium]|nr:glycosyl hydrolase [Candidatus Sumerlaeota bacterium]
GNPATYVGTATNSGETTMISRYSFPWRAMCILARGAATAEVKDFHAIIPADGQCYHGIAVSMYDTFEEDFAGFQDAVGKKVAAMHWFSSALNKQGKPSDWAAQQRPFLARCKERGCLPCINYGFKSDEGVFAGFDRYTSGGMDKQLEGMANLFLEYQDPILLVINHEMNGNWYPWSAEQKHSNEEAALADKNDATSHSSPEAVFKGYIESWRYIHKFLRDRGCKNVAFCFVPGASAYVNTERNPYHFPKYYPGDEYVDWLGFDTYNNTPPADLERLTVELEQLAKSRPLMVKEWGTCATRAKQYLGGKDNYPGDGAWMNAFFDLLERHPSIKMENYFHRGKDYKITRPGGEEALNAYKQRIQNDKFVDTYKPPQ